MKILLVVSEDCSWSTTVRANALKKRWVEHEVDIVNALQTDIGDIFDNYDVVHILYSGGATCHGALLDCNKNKIFTSVASERTLDGIYENKKDLLAYYRNSKKIVALNKNLEKRTKDFIGEEYAGKVVYIPNGTDVEMFKPKKFVVGFVGCSANQNRDYKGLPLIRQACTNLGLELLVQEHDYPVNIVPHEDMYKFYEQIDCLAIASKGEGSNNPTLEALAMNKPVISTRVGNAEELKGVVLVDRTVEDIERGLLELVPRYHIINNFNWNHIANKYLKLYET